MNTLGTYPHLFCSGVLASLFHVRQFELHVDSGSRVLTVTDGSTH